MTSYLIGAATAAAFAFAAGAWVQNEMTPASAGASPAQSQTMQAQQIMQASGPQLPLTQVDRPKRTLTNLTVYADGRDVGRVKSVAVDQGGTPDRVEIAFNDGQSPAWIDAAAIHYDSEHKRAVTALEPGEIKALAATRFR